MHLCAKLLQQQTLVSSWLYKPLLITAAFCMVLFGRLHSLHMLTQCLHQCCCGTRRCCGDVDHFDLAKWSFEKLGELKWGVLALQYRPVPCDYVPPHIAQPLKNPSPGIPDHIPYGAQRETRDWPELRSSSIQTRIVFDDSLQNGFYDASWKAWMQVCDVC